MQMCRTDLEESEFEYRWTITKFSERLKWLEVYDKVDVIKSSTFSTGTNNDLIWRFELMLCDEMYGTDKNSDEIIVSIVHERRGDYPPCRLQRSLFIATDKDRKVSIQKWTSGTLLNSSQPFSFGHASPPSNNIYKLSKKMLSDMSNAYLPNDSLTIVCQIKLRLDKTIDTSIYNDIELSKNQSGILNDFLKLFEDKKFCDVTFVVGTKFRAHKAILSARSAVFFEMFKQQEDEKKIEIDQVTIDDVNPVVFMEMLRYIYTNDVNNLDEIAKDLLHLADKYQLNELKEMCGKSIANSINIDNVAEIHVLANRCNAEYLLKHSRNFMARRIPDVMQTAGYHVMENEHPQLVLELYRSSVKIPIDKERNADQSLMTVVSLK